MSATAIVAIVSAALTLLENLIPQLKSAFASGEVSEADQQALMDKLNALRKTEAFTGPEWQIEQS